MTSLKDQQKLLKDAGKGLVDGIRKHRGPLGSFTEFPKEIIRTIASPFTKKNKNK